MIKAHENVTDLRLPRIGVIVKGGEMTRGATAKDNRPGKDLEYFRLTKADPAVMKAWRETFGDEPRSISGILPYADPAECLSVWDELYDSKRLLWRGDGERLHIKLDGNAYVRYAPDSGPMQPAPAGAKVGQGKVMRRSRLRLLLPQLRIAGIFEIASGSAIDADELWGNLMWIKSTVPTLQGAPVTVFRAPRQFNIPNRDNTGTIAVTKHMLHLMLDGRYLDALLPSPVAGQLAPLAAAPALSAGAIVTDSDIDDAPEIEDGDFEDEAAINVNVKPAQATPPDDGPLADDELTVKEAPAADFVNVAAALLEVDAAAVKDRLHALGYDRIPGKPAERVKAYRALKADPAAQDALFDDDPDAAQAALATLQGKLD